VLAALDQPQGRAVLNVGGGRPVRLDALVAAIGEACGVQLSLEHQGEQPGDVPLTWADSSAIQERLGWSAQVRLVEGLRRVVESMR
jgi:UDP-glucuronate 4-epimerase